MSNEKNMYLCGGVLFFMLCQAKQTKRAPRNQIKGKSYSHSNPRMMESFVIALRSDDTIKEGDLIWSKTFEKDVSHYQNCKVNKTSFLQFTESPFVSNYDDLVNTQYTKALERMRQFVQRHLDPDRYKWLLNRILDIIENDSGIAKSDSFFITGDGAPKTKEEMKCMKDFCLPAVLVGVMHYILLYRDNNTAGEDTLNAWSQKETGKERKYADAVDMCIDREINVTLDYSQPALDMVIQKIEQPEGSSVNENYPQSMPDTDVQKSERIEESQSSKKCPSEVDVYLYEYFKTKSETVLTYIIDNDPSGGPTNRLLPYNVDQLTKYWMPRSVKIEDREMRETVVKILDLLNQYRYYLSDEFLRLIEDQNLLTFRNQSQEEGRKLEEILRPKTAELRHELRQQYRKLHNMPEIDQKFFDIIAEEEEEPPRSAFQDPPEPPDFNKI